MNEATPKRWPGRLVVVVLLIVAALLAWAGWMIVTRLFDAERWNLNRANLKQIGLALHSYHDKYDCFPPAYVRGPDGTPWHSWRTLLLPYLSQEKLYEEYRFDEPWNGPQNSQLVAKQPDVFRSPMQRSSRPGVTGYLGVVSRRTLWPAYFSARIKDVFDGISNTIQLLDDPRSDIVWTEPRDLREHEALSLLAASNGDAKPSSDIQTFCVLLCDGVVRKISVNMHRDLFVSLLTPRYRGSLVPNDVWPAGLLTADLHEDRSLPALVEGKTFDGVQQVPTPWVSSDPNKTTLYCATMQIAWDQLRPAPNEPVEVTNATAEVALLNDHPFPTTGLDPNALKTRIGDLRTFRDNPLVSAAVAEQGIKAAEHMENATIVECRLHKLAKYPEAMFRFATPLKFEAEEKSAAVASFGWPGSQEAAGEMALPALTVTIPSYRSSEDFIVVLSTTSGRADEIVLARVPLDGSLQKTWENVQERIVAPPKEDPIRALRSVDTLQIPVMAIGLVDNLRQLEGLQIPVESKPDRFIALCRQSIQLRLDEFGAELLSDNMYPIGENGYGPQEDPNRPKKMIFDRPFYMAMRERESSEPYFQAWIASPTIMEPMGP